MFPVKPLVLSVLLIAIGTGPSQAEDAPPAAPGTGADRPHHVYLVGQLRVMQPWIDADTDTATLADGYLVVENRGQSPDKLVGVDLGIADEVSLSTSASETTAASSGMPIAAGGTLVLKPGDAHLVLHGLRHDIRKGDRIPGIVRFEEAGPVTVEFTTDRADALNDDQSEPSAQTGAPLIK